MKKNILFLACISTFVHAMEKNFFSIELHGTTINLNKSSLSNADGKVDLIVVGRNQQRTLQKPNIADSHRVGQIMYPCFSLLYEKNKDDESASDDDTYKPYTNDKQEWYKNAHTTTIQKTFISIIEPRITKSHYHDQKEGKFVEGFDYYAERQDSTDPNSTIFCEANGDEALEEASLDLKICYLIALKEGADQGHKSIALPALSTQVGFPREKAAPLAIKTIMTFIKRLPSTYDRIELVVKKRSEFKMYKELLLQYAEK